jgi:hypothetical protein
MRLGRGWAALAVVVLIASGAAPAGATPERRSAPQVTRLAGHKWHYHAQIDGKRGVDRIVIVGGKDLALNKYGPGSGGSGHFTVHVRLAGTTRTVSSRQSLFGYISPLKHWTPWFGATNLDHRSGKEILVGFTTGAHTQGFTALTYRDGRLSVLPAPGPGGSTGWEVNSSYGTGSEGWLCTSKGVEARSVYPTSSSHKHFRIVRNRSVYRSTRWVRTHHFARTVAANSKGNPPGYTDGYARFACPGLPNAF